MALEKGGCCLKKICSIYYLCCFCQIEENNCKEKFDGGDEVNLCRDEDCIIHRHHGVTTMKTSIHVLWKIF